MPVLLILLAILTWSLFRGAMTQGLRRFEEREGPGELPSEPPACATGEVFEAEGTVR